MAQTSKRTPDLSSENVLRDIYNDSDKSITTSSFISAKVGHKIVRNVISSTIDDFEHYDSSTLLFTLRVTYTNAAHDDIVSVERTA